MIYHKHDRYPRKRIEDIAKCTPIQELLHKQRKGQFLNRYEKEEIKKYAERRRKENLSKKK